MSTTRRWRRRCSPSGARCVVRIAGEERLIAAEDAGRYRDALGVMPPGGLPEAFLERRPRLAPPARACATRKAAARSRPPRRASASAGTSPPSSPSSSARSCSSAASSVRAAASASGATPTSCAACGAPRSPRSAARSSRSSARRSRASSRRGTGSTAGRPCARRSCRSRRSRCRSPCGRASCCPRRVPGYRPEQLDALCASGEVVWVGAGLDRVAALLPRGRRGARRRRRGDPADPARCTRRSAPPSSGARSSGSTCSRTPGSTADEALPALWDLVWAGEVTNDAWTPLRAGRRHGVPKPERRPRRFSRTRATAATATQGRWSLTGRLFAGPPERRALAELLLERQGIVTRDGVRAEGIPGGYGAVYAELRGARDARPLPPRLLRRGARRRPVRARRRGRAAARAARGRGGARA